MPSAGSCVREGTLVLKRGAYPESLAPPLVETETPFPKTETVLQRTKIWSWLPTGPETKNDCAGEGQQQLTEPRPFFRELFVSLIFLF
jgi:hypothetical protein